MIGKLFFWSDVSGCMKMGILALVGDKLMDDFVFKGE